MPPSHPRRFLFQFPSVLLSALAFALTLRAAPLSEDSAGRALLQSAQRAIAAYHAGQPKSDRVLRVVYFHPSDRDPLSHYAERLDRVMGDVSDFYRDGLRRFGLENSGLPLERKDGRLVLHVVRGKFPASAYNYESGDKTADEIRAALKGTFDLDREHVLVIYALCRKASDGRYVFDAPYYGSGSQRHGLCHAADCELLDPQLLSDTRTKMVFTEHYYPRVEQTVAGFNSMYLGGTAHELGHALGLFHDAGMKRENESGLSLMGSGNRSYRNEVWGGDDPAYLARVSALHLASHPFFTGSNRGRDEEIHGGIEGVIFASEPRTLRIRGRVTGAIPAYAVVAYVWPTGTTDHASRTFPVALTGADFDLSLPELRLDSLFMRLVSFHVNGGTTWEDYRFGFDAAGRPETPVLFKWPWIVARAEKAVMKKEGGARALLTDESISRAPSPQEQRMLRVLRGAIEPPPIIDLGKVTAASASLSDAGWTDAKVGWGKVARNFYWFDEKIQNGVFLQLGGQFFDQGLYAHAPSRYAFDLGAKWQTFTANVGLRDGAPEFGSAVFRVLGDGQELYRSPVMRVGARADVKITVTGVKKLELLTAGGEGNAHGSWSIWAEPRVSR
jgi:hypothetical protein